MRSVPVLENNVGIWADSRDERAEKACMHNRVPPKAKRENKTKIKLEDVLPHNRRLFLVDNQGTATCSPFIKGKHFNHRLTLITSTFTHLSFPAILINLDQIILF